MGAWCPQMNYHFGKPEKVRSCRDSSNLGPFPPLLLALPSDRIARSALAGTSKAVCASRGGRRRRHPDGPRPGLSSPSPSPPSTTSPASAAPDRARCADCEKMPRCCACGHVYGLLRGRTLLPPPPRWPGLAPTSPTTHSAPFGALVQAAESSQRHRSAPSRPATEGARWPVTDVTAAARSCRRPVRLAPPAAASETCAEFLERARGPARTPGVRPAGAIFAPPEGAISLARDWSGSERPAAPRRFRAGWAQPGGGPRSRQGRLGWRRLLLCAARAA